jgi:hypothetical protein
MLLNPSRSPNGSLLLTTVRITPAPGLERALRRAPVIAAQAKVPSLPSSEASAAAAAAAAAAAVVAVAADRRAAARTAAEARATILTLEAIVPPPR